jgi:hypothetical protein
MNANIGKTSDIFCYGNESSCIDIQPGFTMFSGKKNIYTG